MKPNRYLRVLLFAFVLLVAAVALKFPLVERIGLSAQKLKGQKSVADRVAEYGSNARSRVAPDFAKAEIAYPPARVWLVCIKAEKRLELYAAGAKGPVRFIKKWGVLAASGELGPKLREGDYQVPEGIYPIELLNPNSSYHLSLRVNYPNVFDREQTRQEGRANLGGDIMIHGKSVSIGCIAIGDPAIEEVFVLGADVGIKNITVILTPVDFRRGKSLPKDSKLPPWTGQLYEQIKTNLALLPQP
ncbi:MAG TPA: hypothetical protein VFA77_16870 [Candidatus Eisenbacteria bacterium]|nr:hypothetical protein [Candidatus Eisenbacteria bacterium]